MYKIGSIYKRQDGELVRIDKPFSTKEGYAVGTILTGRHEDGGSGAVSLATGRYFWEEGNSSADAHLTPGERDEQGRLLITDEDRRFAAVGQEFVAAVATSGLSPKEVVKKVLEMHRIEQQPSAEAPFQAGKYYKDRGQRICYVATACQTQLTVSMWDSHNRSWTTLLPHKPDGSFCHGGAYALMPGEIDLASSLLFDSVPRHPDDSRRRIPAGTLVFHDSLYTTMPADSPQDSADPSIARDKAHEPLPIAKSGPRDNFPDLKGWTTTKQTEGQKPKSTSWWARG